MGQLVKSRQDGFMLALRIFWISSIGRAQNDVVCSKSNALYLFPWKLRQIQIKQ